MKFLLTIALLILPFSVLAAEETPLKGMPGGLYKLDKNHASIIWKVDHLGLSDYTARFTDFNIEVDFQPQTPETSRVRATINPVSIETDYKGDDDTNFNKELSQEAGWFNATQFPEIKFDSTSVKITDEEKGTGTVTGDLTFLGKTKPVTLDVTFNKAIGHHPFANKPAVGFSATTQIKRSDYGMTKYLPQIGDTVDIIIEAEFMYAQ